MCSEHVSNLQQPLDKLVDFITTVSCISTLRKVVQLSLVSSKRRRQLERPAKVGGFLEVRTRGVQFVDQVFHTDDVELPKTVLNDRVVGHRNTLLVDFGEPTLVKEGTGCRQGWVSVRDKRLDQAKHGDGSRVQLDENSVVDLTETKQLQDLAHFWGNAHDTTDADHQSNLGLRIHVHTALLLCLTSNANQIILYSAILLHEFLCTFESLVFLGRFVLMGKGVSEMKRKGTKNLTSCDKDKPPHEIEYK